MILVLGLAPALGLPVRRDFCAEPIFATETRYSRISNILSKRSKTGSHVYLCEAGISSAGQLEASAAYLQSWVQALRGGPRMVVIAAAQAQGASDLILGRKVEEE